MKNLIDRVGWVSLLVIVEVIVSVLASIFILPIINSESIWSYIVVGLIIFVNVFIFLGVLIIRYYKEVKTGSATSIIVKICAVFLIVYIVGAAILLFSSLIN